MASLFKTKVLILTFMFLQLLALGIFSLVNLEHLRADFFSKSIWVILGMVVFTGVLAYVFVNEMITKPIQKLNKLAQNLATGDLTKKAYLSTRGEIGLLGTNMNQATNKLRELITSISGIAQTVAISAKDLGIATGEVEETSHQVAATMEQLAAGSTEIASAVENSVVKMEETNKTIAVVNDNIAQVSKVTSDTERLIFEGKEIIVKQQEAMETTSVKSRQVDGAIKELQHKVNEINNIINSITGIAQQTNLLALNAAIEAARAGTEGRGFAVVAEEVRKLAESSAKSAEETRSLLNEVIEEMHEVSVFGGETQEAISAQQQVVDSTNVVFEKISAGMNRLAAEVDNITQAVENLTANAVVVNDLMTNIASITQESSAANEEVSASVEEQSASVSQIATSTNNLNKMVDDLQNDLRKFKLTTLAYLPWDSEIASSYLVKAIYKKVTGEDLNLVPVDTLALEEMYSSIAKGYIDGTVSCWDSHNQYFDKFSEHLEIATTNLTDARIGLVVPKYVQTNNIAELNKAADKFRGKIVAIEPRAGVTQQTYQAAKAYGLQLEVETGDSNSMIDELAKAIENKEWIVVTGWAPHWKFAQWDLKFLQDDRNIFGANEEIKTIIRKDLETDNPALYTILKNFKWDAELSGALAMKIRKGALPELAATEFLTKNPQLLKGL